MRVLKKLNAALALTLTLALVAPIQTPVTPVAVAEAATVKINKTKKTLKVGQTYQLKITGTKKTVKWKSSKKSVATVSSKGKVKAKAVGKTNITATVGGKTYKCKITVKASENPALKNAPFSAQEVTAEGFSFVTPKDWITSSATQNGVYVFASAPSAEHKSGIIATISDANTLAELDYSTLKMILAEQYSEEVLVATAAQSYENAIVKNYKTADVEMQLGTAFHLYYEVEGTLNGTSVHVIESDYILCVDDSLIILQALIVPEEVIENPTVTEAHDYAIQSLIKK